MAFNPGLYLPAPQQVLQFPLASYSTSYPHAPAVSEGPRVVPWERAWDGSSPPAPYTVNLSGVALFSQCSSIYIDNTNCPFQINVDFGLGSPTIICAAGGAGWFPVVVYNLSAVVSALEAIPGRTGSTRIWFANFIVPPVYIAPGDDTQYPSWRSFSFDSGQVRPVQNTNVTISFQVGNPNYGCYLKRLQFDFVYNPINQQSASETLAIYFGGQLCLYKWITFVYDATNPNPIVSFDIMDMQFLSPVPNPVLTFFFNIPPVSFMKLIGMATCQDTPQLNN